MQKIPTIFERDWDSKNKHLVDVRNPQCDWVFSGDEPVIVQRKYDGTCMMFTGYEWFARREVKKDKTPPEGFIPIEIDDGTGKTMGWVPMEPQGYWHPFLEALRIAGPGDDDIQARITKASELFRPGTYELCGPKIGGNPEGFELHRLESHDDAMMLPFPSELSYDHLRWYVTSLWLDQGLEGLVFKVAGEAGPNRRMAKLKFRDFPKSD